MGKTGRELYWSSFIVPDTKICTINDVSFCISDISRSAYSQVVIVLLINFLALFCDHDSSEYYLLYNLADREEFLIKDRNATTRGQYRGLSTVQSQYRATSGNNLIGTTTTSNLLELSKPLIFEDGEGNH